MTAILKTSPDAPAPLAADGRRRRGEDNRARIVAAMLEIVQGGEIAPSAEQVALRADVGLRTVFRHFNDMDSLYREMSDVIAVEVHAMVDQPFRAPDGPEQVIELVHRRAQVFEKIGPFKRASAAFRHRSKFLDSDGARLVRMLRELLLRVLPAGLASDPSRVEVLDLLLSFESWSRLRREQGLSTAQAQEVLTAAVRRLIV